MCEQLMYNYTYQRFLQINTAYIDVSTIKLIHFNYETLTITVKFKNRKDKPINFDFINHEDMQTIENTFRNL